ncbi:testis-expressed protein 264 homolog [Melanotaenia boesemani]|uniref:testis-expressed protein 264 homolog n=1 Tax=Melanotaenia boesemani TaxID=1250792 RepID=UPI001C05517A|nr:testis-expressed protein 264 homolog [Melanotaenia boesemani]
MPDLLSLCVVVILLGLFFLTVAGYIFYLGLQINVKVHTGVPPIKKITFAYKFKEGPYKNCGQLFKEAHFIGPELSCIGVFYDHPKKVLGPLCRYAIGSILTDGENKADEELLKRYKTSGFNVFTFPQVTHVVTTSFPHGTFFLNYLRMRRVYQQLEHYIQERRLCAHPYLEIHRDGQIQFMVPLARQGDFYVPEVRQVERRLSEQEESFSDTDISGADSNSEYSSGSGVLLSDSRETSPAGSSVHSVPIGDQGSRDFKGRSSSGTPFKELDVVQSGAHQEEREKQRHGDSKQKNLEVPTQGLWGIVGGEE